MKCVSNGRKLDKYQELEAYEFKYFGVGWMPEKDTMVYVLLGTNELDNGNGLIFDAELVNYTGELKDNALGDCVYHFKNGYLHNDNGYAVFACGKGFNAKNGHFDDNTSEKWALDVLQKFRKDE